MSNNSVPPSVMRPHSVAQDCRWVLRYWGAPASTAHVTIGNDMSTGALSLNSQTMCI